MGRKTPLSEEHKQKMRVARADYWVKRRAEKAAEALASMGPDAKPEVVIEGITTKPIRPPKLTIEQSIDNSRGVVLEKIYKHKDEIIKAQIEAAKGFYFLSADGKTVYQKKPDLGAGEYLMNQLIGKPKEQIEMKAAIKLLLDL